MATSESNKFDKQQGFKWNQDAWKNFQRAVAQAKVEGDIDPGITASEALRRVLESWSSDPDPSYLET